MNKPVELSKLIEGLLVIIAISIAVGKFDDLARFAREVGIAAMLDKRPTPLFFKSTP